MSTNYILLKRRMQCVTVKFITVCFGILLLTATNQILAQPALVTDQPDYPPGSTVILTGNGFQPGETVTLQVLHHGDVGDNEVSSAHQPWTVNADGSGNFVTTWYIPLDGDELNATLIATADGQSSGLHAETIFTDANWTIGPSYNDLCGGVETELTFTITQTGTSAGSLFPNGRFRIAFPGTAIVSAVSIVSVSNSKNWIASLLPGNDVCLRAATAADALANLETITFKLVVTPPNSIGQAQVNGVSTAFAPTCPGSPAGTTPNLPLNIVRVNRLLPAFTQCPSSIVVNTDPGLCHAVVNYTALVTGTNPVMSYEFTGATTGSDNGTGSGLAFNKGTTHVKLTASNSCGSTTCEFDITVNDMEPPSITCPENVVLSACEAATWALPTATDNCPGVTVEQTGGPAPGSTIDNGTSATITYTATDASNNQTSCSFTVSRKEALAASCSNTNPQLYFGYTGDQTSTVKVVPSGGAGPYTVSISMNRALKCNIITNTGDELWIGGDGTTSSSNTTCPATGEGAVPVSEATGVITSYSVKVTLMEDADITATVTDADGCVTTCTTHIYAEDVRCFAGNSDHEKVAICHKTGSAKKPCVSICVDESSVDAHLAHGDFPGICNPECAASSSIVNNSSTLQKQPAATTAGLKISVFPNPATTEFKLRLESNSRDEVRLIVTDIYGRQVFQAKGTVDKLYNFGQTFKSGMYIIKVVQGKQIQTLKVTKAKG